MEHTPGNWSPDDADVSDRYRYVFGGGRLVCRITLLDQQSEADAKLIAAAPELLMALQKAVQRQGFSNNELIDARAAIAKATQS